MEKSDYSEKEKNGKSKTEIKWTWMETWVAPNERIFRGGFSDWEFYCMTQALLPKSKSKSSSEHRLSLKNYKGLSQWK